VRLGVRSLGVRSLEDACALAAVVKGGG